jgi:hypothetical protein
MESGSLNLPEPSGPHRPVMGLFYLYIHIYIPTLDHMYTQFDFRRTFLCLRSCKKLQRLKNYEKINFRWEFLVMRPSCPEQQHDILWCRSSSTTRFNVTTESNKTGVWRCWNNGWSYSSQATPHTTPRRPVVRFHIHVINLTGDWPHIPPHGGRGVLCCRSDR